MSFKFLSSSEKKEIIRRLNESFGIKELPYLLIQTGKEKIRAYSGNFSKDELIKLSIMVNVELIGLYLLKLEKSGIRLSHDAVSLLKDKIIKNIIEIDEKQAEQWVSGKDLEIKAEKKFVILKYKEDLIGCGKSTGERIINLVPKERRVK